jgi:hypothetical protein
MDLLALGRVLEFRRVGHGVVGLVDGSFMFEHVQGHDDRSRRSAIPPAAVARAQEVDPEVEHDPGEPAFLVPSSRRVSR